MGFVSKLASPIPIDPISTHALGKMSPQGQALFNPAGTALKNTVGQKTASKMLDPLGVGNVTQKNEKKNQVNIMLNNTSEEDRQKPTPSLLG